MKIGNWKLKIVFTLFFFFLCVNTASAAATISKSLSRPINELGLMGWWTMDGPDILTNIADKSGQGNNGSLSHSGSGTTTAPGPIGQALSFDGTNDQVSSGADVGGLDAKTFAGWYKWTSLGSGWQLMTMESDAVFDNVNYVGLTTSGSAEKYIFCYQSYAGGVSSFNVGTDFAPSLNTWYHVACAVNKSDNSLRLYINGAQYNVYQNAAVGSATFYNPSGGVAIGGKTSAAYFFNGSIDDVRVYNRALSAAEVLRLYQLGATSKIAKTLPGRDSLTSGLVGWWTMDGPDMLTNVADKSGQGNTGKLSHSGSGTTTVPGKLGQALSFDKVDDLVNVGSPAVLDDLTTLSYCAWIYPRTFGELNVGMIFGKNFIKYLGINSSNKLIIFVDYDGVTNLSKTASNPVSLNTWSHVCATWAGGALSSGITIYINGVAVSATGVDGAGSPVSESSSNQIIGNSGGGTRTFDGALDDLRIYNRALSAAEVLQLYNLGR